MLSFEVARYFKSTITKMLSLVLPFILITFDAFSQVSTVQTFTKMPNTQFNKSGDLITAASPASSCSELNKSQEGYKIGVLELRNYVMKPGYRDRFISFFEENLIAPQAKLNGYPIGQYRIKGLENNFCWLRGFESMRSRSAFLPAFYYGPDWKKYRETANNMLTNNDNVYLLRPVVLQNDSLVPAQFIKSSGLRPGNHIAVVELYTANHKLDQLMMYFAKGYLPALKEAGVDKYSLWISEFGENDFPRLPVFQDKNLLVMITYYKDELEYTEKMKAVESKLEENLKGDLQNIITLKNTWILYPTAKTAEQ
jgi:hypothetical protein